MKAHPSLENWEARTDSWESRRLSSGKLSRQTSRTSNPVSLLMDSVTHCLVKEMVPFYTEEQAEMLRPCLDICFFRCCPDKLPVVSVRPFGFISVSIRSLTKCKVSSEWQTENHRLRATTRAPSHFLVALVPERCQISAEGCEEASSPLSR